jgi:hypothetical protein
MTWAKSANHYIIMARGGGFSFLLTIVIIYMELFLFFGSAFFPIKTGREEPKYETTTLHD